MMRPIMIMTAILAIGSSYVQAEDVVSAFEQAQADQKLPKHYKEPSPEKRAREYVQRNNMRMDAIRQNGYIRGVSEGRVAGFREQQSLFTAMRSDMDRIYNVSNLYLEDGTLQPPIILTSDNLLEMAPDGRSYKRTRNRREIISDARYVTEKLNWETYLVSEDDLTLPTDYFDSELKARDRAESSEERKFYKLGFEEGKQQASMEVEQRLDKLTTIVMGMRQGYKEMLAGTVTVPQTASEYEPMAGNGRQIEVGIRSNRIVEDAQFVLHPNAGKAFLGTHKRNR